MKKLLLSLGALSAVVAPVAAVVACGSTTDSKLDTIKKAAISSLDQFTTLTPANKTIAVNAINAAKDEAGVTAAIQTATESTQPGTATTVKSLDAELEKIMTENGYAAVDADDLKAMEDFIKPDAEFISSTTGKEVVETGTHGSNDFIILVKDGDRRDMTTETFEDSFTGGNKVNVEPIPDGIAAFAGEPKSIGVKSDANHWQQVGFILDSSDANWIINDADVAKANRVIYLQTDGKTATFEVADLVTVNGKTYALNAGTSSNPSSVFDSKFDMPEIEVSWTDPAKA